MRLGVTLSNRIVPEIGLDVRVDAVLRTLTALEQCGRAFRQNQIDAANSPSRTTALCINLLLCRASATKAEIYM